MERSNIAMMPLAWFRPDEWRQIKRLCPDLQDTYAEWLANAEAGIEAFGSPLKEQVIKVILTVDDLRKWKRSTGRKVDARARANLAVKIAHKTHGTHH